ncbi:hypothetical protein AB1Y20_010370 [Prymnesium parvum]|uniref:Pentacotripeptide-repeat region of PRORP domain-containing protein n=1 Tax=Prymnesium parvum TaxID=97485 RepID=A0AB34IP19_PRYPA
MAAERSHPPPFPPLPPPPRPPPRRRRLLERTSAITRALAPPDRPLVELSEEHEDELDALYAALTQPLDWRLPSQAERRERMAAVDTRPEVFFERRERRADSYAFLIRCLGVQGQLGAAHAALEEMRRLHIAPDANVYCALVDACGRAGDVQAAEAAAEAMRADGLRQVAPVFAGLAKAYRVAGRDVEAWAPELLRRMRKRRVTEDAPMRTAIICAAVEAGKTEVAWRYFEGMREAKVRADAVAFTAMIMACVRDDRLEMARPPRGPTPALHALTPSTRTPAPHRRTPPHTHSSACTHYHHLTTSQSHHHLTTTSPPPHHYLTTTSPPPHHHLTTTSPPHHHLTTTSPPPHHLTTTSPPPHHHLTTTSPPPHHLTTSQSHHHLTTTSPPPHHHHPPPHHHLTTTSPPHHHLTTTSPPPHHHLTTSPPHHLTISPPPHHHLTTTSPPPHHHLTTTSPPHHLTTSQSHPLSPPHHPHHPHHLTIHCTPSPPLTPHHPTTPTTPTTPPPHHPTTPPPHLPTSPPPHLPTTPPPLSPPHHHPTFSPPHHLTSSPPHRLTTTPPPHHLTTTSHHLTTTSPPHHHLTSPPHHPHHPHHPHLCPSPPSPLPRPLPSQADRLMEQMNSLRVEPTLATRNAYINACAVRCHSLSHLHKFEKEKKRYLVRHAIDVEVSTPLRLAFAQLGRLEDEGVAPSQQTYLALMRACAGAAEVERAQNLMSRMLDVDVTPHKAHFHMLLKACVRGQIYKPNSERKNHVQVALAVPPSMVAIGLEVEPTTIDLVLETHTAGLHAYAALDVLEELYAHHGLAPTRRAFELMLRLAFTLKRPRLARELMEAMAHHGHPPSDEQQAAAHSLEHPHAYCAHPPLKQATWSASKGHHVPQPSVATAAIWRRRRKPYVETGRA